MDFVVFTFGKKSSAYAIGGRQWSDIFHFHVGNASIKPRLLFSHADFAS